MQIPALVQYELIYLNPWLGLIMMRDLGAKLDQSFCHEPLSTLLVSDLPLNDCVEACDSGQGAVFLSVARGKAR